MSQCTFHYLKTCQAYRSEIIYLLIYGPNGDTPSFFVNLSRELISCHGENIIMAGDFNLSSTWNLITSAASSELISKLGMTAFHWWLYITLYMSGILTKTRFSKHFTWSLNHVIPENAGMHCTFDFASRISRSVKYLHKISVSPSILSHHSFCFSNTHRFAPKRGPGYWKLSNSLLCDRTCLHWPYQLCHPKARLIEILYMDSWAYGYPGVEISEGVFKLLNRESSRMTSK